MVQHFKFIFRFEMRGLIIISTFMILNIIGKIFIRNFHIPKGINNINRTCYYSYGDHRSKSESGFRKEAFGKIGQKRNSKPFGSYYSQQSNLWQMLRQQRKAVQGTAEIKQYLALCSKIGKYYKPQKLHEFKSCKEDLQKLLNNLTSLPFPDLSLENYFDVLDFLAVLQHTQLIKKEYINTLKDLLFLNLLQTFESISNLSYSQQLGLYSRLAPFNHPDLPFIADAIEISLDKLQKRFDFSLLQSLFLGIHSRKFLSTSDMKILKLILEQLQGYSSELSIASLARIVHVTESIFLRANFGDANSLAILDDLEEKLLTHVRSAPLEDAAIIYLIHAQFKNIQKSRIREAILDKIMERMERDEPNSRIIEQLFTCLHKLADYQLTSHQIQVILNYLSRAYEDQAKRSIVYSHIRFELAILELVKSNHFDSQIQKLRNFVSREEFQVQWSLIAQFSLKNEPFSLEKLESKIKPKTSELKLDGNYLKAACSIGIQYQFYKDSAVLKKSYDTLVASLKSCKWSEQHLIWLEKESAIHENIVRAFHRLYHPIYIESFKNIALKGGKSSPLNKFYAYVASYFDSHNCSKQFVKQLPLLTLEAIINRALKKQANVNSFLLFVINYNLQNRALYFQSDLVISIMRLLLHYSYHILQSQESLHQYHSIVIHFLHFYPYLKLLSIQFNQILKRMIASPQYLAFYRSFYFDKLLTEAMKHVQQIKDADLNALILRTSLKKNIFRGQNKLNCQYFTEQEQSKITAISNKTLLDQQSNQLISFLYLEANPLKSKELKIFAEQLPIQTLEYILLSLTEPIINEQLYTALLEQYAINFSPQTSNYVAMINKDKMAKSNSSYVKFLQSITTRIKVESVLINDHLHIVRRLLKYGVVSRKYFENLGQYMSKNFHKYKENSSFLELYCMLPLININLQANHIKHILSQEDTDPNNQLKLIALYHQKLKESSDYDDKTIKDLITRVINNSLVPLQKNLYNYYIEAKYQLLFKNIKQDEERTIKLGRNLSELDHKIFIMLRNNGVTVSEQKMLDDTVYVINQKLTLFLGNNISEALMHVLKDYLKIRFKNYIYVMPTSEKKELTNLMNLLESKSFIEKAAIESIRHAINK